MLIRSYYAVVFIPKSIGIAAFLVESKGWLASKLASLSATLFPLILECPRAYLIETL